MHTLKVSLICYEWVSDAVHCEFQFTSIIVFVPTVAVVVIIIIVIVTVASPCECFLLCHAICFINKTCTSVSLSPSICSERDIDIFQSKWHTWAWTPGRTVTIYCVFRLTDWASYCGHCCKLQHVYVKSETMHKNELNLYSYF